MATRKMTAPKIRLNVPVGAPPLTMEMDRFFEFSFWMAEELLDLEAAFVDWQTAASNPFPATYDANGLPDDLKLNFDC